MSKSNAMVHAAITGLFAFGAGALAMPAHADEDHSGDEQCAGVIKAARTTARRP